MSKALKAKNTKSAKANKKATPREIQATQEYRLMAFDYVMDKVAMDISEPANLAKVIKATDDVAKYLQTGSFTQPNLDAVPTTPAAPAV